MNDICLFYIHKKYSPDKLIFKIIVQGRVVTGCRFS